jgi:hypothetical protein
MNQNFVDHCRPDQVRFQFDWEFPTDNQAMFQLRIEREGRISRVDFELNLCAFPASDLRRLEDFLIRRHSGCTSSPEVAQISARLLNLSLEQTQPGLSVTERLDMVRQLLLADTPKRMPLGRE